MRADCVNGIVVFSTEQRVLILISSLYGAEQTFLSLALKKIGEKKVEVAIAESRQFLLRSFIEVVQILQQ
jgi:hypothetical protein